MTVKQGEKRKKKSFVARLCHPASPLKEEPLMLLFDTICDYHVTYKVKYNSITSSRHKHDSVIVVLVLLDFLLVPCQETKPPFDPVQLV